MGTSRRDLASGSTGPKTSHCARPELAAVQFGKSEDLASLGSLADRMLRAFVASDLSCPAGSILGIEEEFRSPMIADCPDLLARLDLMVETDEALVVTDFKTARSRWSSGDVNAAERLLIVDHELAQQFADKPIKLRFAVITKTKPPDVEIQPVPADPLRIERIRQLIRRVWAGIQTGIFYPVPNAMNCPSCGYRDRCARWIG